LVDRENRFAFVPSFAKFPVNDRVILDRCSQIWAAERLLVLETRVQSILNEAIGFGMHSERFLNHTIFPRSTAGFEIHDHPHMCFSSPYQTSQFGSVTATLGKEKAEALRASSQLKKERKKLVERLVGRQCGNVTALIRECANNVDCKSHES
jgi:hypothetical protein